MKIKTPHHPVILAESLLNAHSPAIVPATLRDAIGPKSGENINVQLQSNDKVLPSCRLNGQDLMTKSFLRFLAQDMQENPQRLHPFTVDLFNQINTLTAGMCVDTDRPLTGN